MSKIVHSSARTMAECRKLGLLPGKVERFVRQAGPHGKRFDLWGWVDVLALGDGEVIAIQSCAMDRRGDHLAKFEEDPKVVESIRKWIAVPGARAELWAWRKVKKKPGGKAMVWRHVVTDLQFLTVLEEVSP